MRGIRSWILGMVWAALALATFTSVGHTAPTGKFYLKNGDRVVFYGDSITEQKLYTTYIESYCVTRFPRWHFTFVHSGWGGDRVTGGGGGPIDVRLKRDVIAYRPTVVTICLGMNDGGYRAFDPGLFDTYVKGYRHILDTLLKALPGVRITLLTASAYDDVTRAENFLGGYNSTLVAYGQAVRELGSEYGLTVADTNAPLVGALARAHAADADLSTRVIPDRVHPGPGGHLLMAAAVLKAWNAPATVADVEIDAGTGKVVRQVDSKVSDLHITGDKITFTHRDNALPWPLDRNPDAHPDMTLMLSVTDEEQDLNRYQLKIHGLKAAKYDLKVDGVEIGPVLGTALDNGVDLAAIPALAPNQQAAGALSLIRKHNDIHNHRWRDIQMKNVTNGDQVSDEIQKQLDAQDRSEADVVALLQTAVQPKPHHVELTLMP